MQQLSAEDLSWGLEVKTFSGRIVIDCDECVELFIGELSKIGFAWQETPHASYGVFDTTFLPWASGVAEVGFEVKRMQYGVLCELGSVIKSD